MFDILKINVSYMYVLFLIFLIDDDNDLEIGIAKKK